MKTRDAAVKILHRARTIGVVGFSSDRLKARYYVPAYMQRVGYRIIPVNPGLHTGLGEKCYPDLGSIPEPVDGVLVFRRLKHIPAIVDAAIEIGAWFIWMQLGIVHEGAAEKA